MHLLRPVTSAQDWEVLHRIRRATLFVTGRHGDARISYDENHPDDRNPGNQCFLLHGDGEPVGVVRLDRREGAAGVVRLVAILPDLQRRGNGRAMMQLLEGEAHACKMRRLLVNADPDAVGFYRRIGWKRERWDPRELKGIAANAVQMSKTLA